MIDQSGVIIVLNGASSSGKTLTAQALVNLIGTDVVCTGFDDILERVKPFEPKMGGIFGQIERSFRILWFQATDGRFGLFKRLHREVVERAQAGQTVIVETALMDERALDDAADCFAPLRSFLIGMKPPLEVSEQWEAMRSDRPQGQARRHYDLVHAHGIYDLVIDPSTMTPDECAAVIWQYVRENSPTAFENS